MPLMERTSIVIWDMVHAVDSEEAEKQEANQSKRRKKRRK